MHSMQKRTDCFYFGGAARLGNSCSFPLLRVFGQSHFNLMQHILDVSNSEALLSIKHSVKCLMSVLHKLYYQTQSIQHPTGVSPLPWSWTLPRWRGIYRSDSGKEEWSPLSRCGAAAAPGTSHSTVVFSRTGKPGVWCRCRAGTGIQTSSWAGPVRPVCLGRPRRSCVEEWKSCSSDWEQERRTRVKERQFLCINYFLSGYSLHQIKIVKTCLGNACLNISSLTHEPLTIKIRI